MRCIICSILTAAMILLSSCNKHTSYDCEVFMNQGTIIHVVGFSATSLEDAVKQVKDARCYQFHVVDADCEKQSTEGIFCRESAK